MAGSLESNLELPKFTPIMILVGKCDGLVFRSATNYRGRPSNSFDWKTELISEVWTNSPGICGAHTVSADDAPSSFL